MWPSLARRQPRLPPGEDCMICCKIWITQNRVINSSKKFRKLRDEQRSEFQHAEGFCKRLSDMNGT
ncbi:unnamed protein product [Moneuplotes crassus]|uniref:Uncharacterized protein n=1 Tax=Euplotes crassus TaxID=5936 RepID=A0AAD1Y0P9_EUPCR|nr:unnamed protein product [Moneuplotes crassus]